MDKETLIDKLKEIELELNNCYFNEYPLKHSYHIKRRQIYIESNPATELIKEIQDENKENE